MLQQFDVPDNISDCISLNVIFQECQTRGERASYCQVVFSLFYDGCVDTHVQQYPSWEQMLQEYPSIQTLLQTSVFWYVEPPTLPVFLERIEGHDGLYDLSEPVIIYAEF